MYFKKFHYSSNFEFVRAVKATPARKKDAFAGSFSVTDFQPAAAAPMGKKQIEYRIERYAGDVYYLTFCGKGWEKNYAQSGLDFSQLEKVSPAGSKYSLKVGDDLSLTLGAKGGKNLLQSVAGEAFGVSGEASMFKFMREENAQFYGMGEKMLGLELSGKKTKFWNTDAWADFYHEEIKTGRPDPLYVSIPYVIIKRENTYIGLLLDNPFASFIMTDSTVNIANQKDADSQPAPAITIGTEMGQPNLVIIPGPDLPTLTRKMQSIVGMTPRPPAWSLGYHQCRWGYQSMDDLRYLDAGMKRHEIPCDGLWLDIEYMRGYRVFTFEEEKNFPDLENNLKEIHDKGRRVVPIIDPGVKAEPGYPVYDSGLAADIFCRNPHGGTYIGLVWPGETAFPDFSMAEARAWWAQQVKSFAQKGITAAWLDMNDPSTGWAVCTEMLYNKGKDHHNSYHNQYALGMAMASREGFQAARPEERPFLLSRSGFTGSSRYTAIWTGDNVSNYHYLKACIPCTLNLALSGIPFNGPDICGFGFDTNEFLSRDWVKAGFLFPFLRNHTATGTRAQEPWAFDDATLRIFRRYIKLRYKLRPYLYNLFVRQSECGEAILRPLFYDFADTAELPLGKLEDQFMVGPYIMQAPFVEEDANEREIVLPAGGWFESESGEWLTGNTCITRTKNLETNPLFIREGAVLPFARNEGDDASFKSNETDFMLFVRPGSKVGAEYSYVFDDGLSYEFKKGKESELAISAAVKGDTLSITTKLVKKGYGDCDGSFILSAGFKSVTVNGKKVKTEELVMDFAGRETTFVKTV